MAKRKTPKAPRTKIAPQSESYEHKDATSVMRPDIGTQPHFKKSKPPQKYRYDDSLAPSMEWDGQNAAREIGEALIQDVLAAETLAEAKSAAAKLKAMSQPFLNWSGKAERLSFEVPTLPLFIHERLSTKAILETLKSHKRDKQIDFDLFGDPQRPIADQLLRAYEHRDKWVNRMILGNSIVVMNSLLNYEGMGGQVQMIYMDPPYGVKFNSNFQPFVRKRDVKPSDDEDMTREPEMVKAYRDTWELGIHSYLTYLRDRLLLARELLTASGSVFVQISDENLHHVREVMDEVFGAENACGVIQFAKTSGLQSKLLYQVCDYILWYAKDKERVKYRQIYSDKIAGEAGAAKYNRIELVDGTRRGLSEDERNGDAPLPPGSRFWVDDNLTSQGNPLLEFVHNGKSYRGTYKTNMDGMKRLASANRLYEAEGTLRFVRYLDDFPAVPLTTAWMDVGGIQSRSNPKIYVVQTSTVAIQRCLLMTTDPGDLILDPTCGSGTTAYVAEQWGRRWITIDTSRVPLALARQRLLTATFDWYDLADDTRGPAGGFVYLRKTNKRGEEAGGIVPHVKLETIAKNESPEEAVLVDRPEKKNGITRVTGPFCVEATIPTPQDMSEGVSGEDAQFAREAHGSFLDRMLEVLRKSPVLRLEGNRQVALKNVRRPAKTLSLSAEAMVDATALGNGATLADAAHEAEEKSGHALALSQKPVAIVFGPENDAVSEQLVYRAAQEANAKSYAHLFVIGFGIQPNARLLINDSLAAIGVAATYVQMTPDVMMGDLLKNMRSSEIFSVCGLPDARLRKIKTDDGEAFEAELRGLDVFDPITMDVSHESGNNVPAWFLDTDYNGLCFHVSQAFFPRTSAWDSLKKALRGEYADSVWDHLAGNISAPFTAGEHKQIAVKVIDDRGNELMVVKNLSEAEA